MDQWTLPPLILYPLGGASAAEAAVDSMRLSLALAGLADANPDRERLLRGRYSEFRLVCLVGKDLMRWIRQCVDFAGRDEVLARGGIQEQSFADLLVNQTPQNVMARLEAWGVKDYRRIFARGIGVNAVFPEPPPYAVLSTEFLERCYSFCDSLFACYQSLKQFTRLEPAKFEVCLYTSDEYLSTIKSSAEDE
jgi:hypothetical protein